MSEGGEQSVQGTPGLIPLSYTTPWDAAHQALLQLKRSRHLNISAFCREAIAEKLERLEAATGEDNHHSAA